MRVIYADDEPPMLEQVCQHLRQQGHTAISLETDNLLAFQDRLRFMLEDGFQPNVVIIGGHNLLRNALGDPILDLNAFAIVNWMTVTEHKAQLEDCRLILFSKDEVIRDTAHAHPEWGFKVVVAKDDPNALQNLLDALQPPGSYPPPSPDTSSLNEGD